MANTPALLAAAVVCMAGVMSPGPNFVAVSHRAVSSAPQEAIAMAVGVALVNTLWAAIALFGLDILLASLPALAWTIKLIGAVYLLWFGVHLFRRSSRPLARNTDSDGSPNFQLALRDGIVANLANPKSMAFYASVFSGVVPAQASAETLLLLVGLVWLISTAWYGSVALVFSGRRVAGFYRRGKTLIERSCGIFLIGVAIRQAPTEWPL